MPRIVVTGAAGFIGFHVAQRLLADGHEVTGLDNFNAYYDVGLKRDRIAQLASHPGFALVEADLINAEAVAECIQTAGGGAVVHLAAQAGVRWSLEHPRAYVDSNVSGFLNILEACRATPVQHLIYASSSSVYGANVKVPFAVTDPTVHPVSMYAATKLANEAMACSYSHLFDIPTTGLRFFTVYGPWGRPDMAYFKFTKAILAGTSIDVFNQGELMRDFTYVDDIVEAIVRLIPKPPSRTQDPEASAEFRHVLHNIGNHSPVKLMEFISTLETVVGRLAVKRFLPMQAGDVRATYADVDALAAAVDFRPRTSLRDGLSRFVAWYREYYGE